MDLIKQLMRVAGLRLLRIVAVPARCASDRQSIIVLVAALLCTCGSTLAATLPEDRADALYHLYDGGGMTIQGPSVLVRKGYKNKVSGWANYYVDMVSSASVDVLATASAYTETRKEASVGVDALHDGTQFGIAFTNSEEDDYSARALNLNVSQELFGGMTTVGISLGLGDDTVRRNGDSDFEAEVDRRSYRLDISQIITRNFVVGLNAETISDEGFLNNPYRSVRFIDSSAASGFSFEAERYPNTRTSNAVALQGRYHLPIRAAVGGQARWFNDSWGIQAVDGEINYAQPVGSRLELEARFRYYRQDAAEFYSDLFPRADFQNFLARDKELSSFSSQTLGVGISYSLDSLNLPGMKRGSINLQADYLRIRYDNFRDVTARASDTVAGTEPLYELDAYVVRAFLSVWF